MSDVLLNLAFFYQMSCNYNIIDNRNQDKGQLIRPLCRISHFLGRHRIRDRNVVVCLLLFRHVWCVCCLLRWGIELATSTMMENKRGTPLLCRDVSGRPLYSEWWQLMHAPAPVLWWDWGWWGAVPPPLLLASGSIWVLKRSGVWLQGDEFQLVPTRCWLVVLRGHSMSVWFNLRMLIFGPRCLSPFLALLYQYIDAGEQDLVN